MSATAIPRSTPPVGSLRAGAPSRRARIAGRIITGIVILLLAFDVGIKLVQAKPAIEGTVQVGYQPHHVLIIGIIGLVCLILYVIPRTAPLGAILWTGYFGGAVATHLRIDSPLFTHILSGVYVATFMWLGLYLRDARVRNLLGPTR